MTVLEGNIVDAATKAGLPYVVVSLDDKYITATDHTGHFRIDVPDGEYTIKIRTALYRPYTGKVVVPTSPIFIELHKAFV